MAKILDMPKLSPTMEEGVLSTWHKKEGDAIGVDDLLAEVETDKATMEFRAFDKGTLLKILVQPGTQVKLGQPVAILGAPGEDISALVSQAAHSPAAATPPSPASPSSPPLPAPARVPAEMQPSGGSGGASGETLPPETSAPQAQREPRVTNVLERTSFPGTTIPVADERQADGGRVIASPYVRKVAREKGIDLHGAHGSGTGGRVLPVDLEALRTQGNAGLARAPPTAPPTAANPRALALEDPEVRALSPMRRTIARRLTESKTTVPHFYLRIDVDATALTELRANINAELAASGAPGGAKSGAESVKVSINDLLIKACAIALVRVPECNASFSQDAILVHRRVDISVAAAIASEVRDLAARARARKLKPEEMTDGTFSISNLGMFGIDEFAAVINPPEGAILAVGQVRDVPVVVDGAVAAGKRLALTLSCDHRVVDGAIGAAFLAELKRLVERPLRVLAG